MSVVETLKSTYEFSRARTLALLDRIENEADAAVVLPWRPGQGRAHIGWQLMHIAVTEEIFATERLASREPRFGDLWASYRGGSTPADQAPTAAQIREVLAGSRAALLETLGEFDDSRLGEIPAALAQRGWTVRTALDVIAWHEAHHQGQSHLTLNLYLATSNS